MQTCLSPICAVEQLLWLEAGATLLRSWPRWAEGGCHSVSATLSHAVQNFGDITIDGRVSLTTAGAACSGAAARAAACSRFHAGAAAGRRLHARNEGRTKSAAPTRNVIWLRPACALPLRRVVCRTCGHRSIAFASQVVRPTPPNLHSLTALHAL